MCDNNTVLSFTNFSVKSSSTRHNLSNVCFDIFHNKTTSQYLPNDPFFDFNNSCIPIEIFAPFIPLATLMSIIGHCIILRTIYKHETLHKPYFILIANHSMADIIFLSFGALFIVYDRFSGRNEIMVMILLACNRSSSHQTMLTTIYLSLNRYLAVRFPLTYQNIATKRRTCFLIGLSWISMTILLSATVEHGRKPFIDRPYLNLLTVALIWFTHSVELPILYYTQREGRRAIEEIQQTTSRLHGEQAEQLDILRQRRKRNKEVGYLLLFNQILLLPYNVGFTVISIVRFPTMDWQCFAFLLSFYACVSAAFHPVVFIKTMNELCCFVKRDLSPVLRHRGRIHTFVESQF